MFVDSVSRFIVTSGDNPDDDRDRRERHETPTERLDRNWGDLVQELRIVQTGVQFLTGFLLTLPFQQKFAQLSQPQVDLYLATVSASIAATAFLLAPVSVHRALFRRHQRAAAVAVAHRMAIVGMVLLSLAITGVATLIFDVLTGRVAAVAAGVVTVAVLSVLWGALPLALREGPSNVERTNGDRA